MSVEQKKPAKGCLQKIITWTVILPVFTYLLLAAAGFILVSADYRPKADAMVILSGDSKPRAAEGIRLYKEKAANKIILTQTLGKGSSATMADTRYMLVKGGVPSYNIQTAYGKATSTFDEARQVAALAKKAEFKSILVVTDPYHTLRARILFTGELSGEGVKVRVAPVRDHWYHPLTWMFTREGWRVTLTEYVKIGGIILGMRGG